MEVDKGLIALKKAELLAGGPVYIGKDFRLPFLPARSTAGPGAGSVAVVLSFGGTRVKKSISMDKGEFELLLNGDHYTLRKGNKVFLEKVELTPTLYHAPEQVFFNLDTKCIFDCKFCTARYMDERITKGLEPEKMLRMVLGAAKRKDFRSVSFTSSVPRSPSDTIMQLIYIIREVRKALPEVPIGVEPYVDSLPQINALREAGANEIKLNLETPDRRIFSQVCVGKDYDFILKAIEHAVKVFGRGKVASNLLFGLGETDECLIQGVEHLAGLGCVATLRPLRVGDLNRAALLKAVDRVDLVTPERILRLAKEEKAVLERHGLTTTTFQTMCHQCRCCDLVPFRDI